MSRMLSPGRGWFRRRMAHIRLRRRRTLPIGRGSEVCARHRLLAALQRRRCHPRAGRQRTACSSPSMSAEGCSTIARSITVPIGGVGIQQTLNCRLRCACAAHTTPLRRHGNTGTHAISPTDLQPCPQRRRKQMKNSATLRGGHDFLHHTTKRVPAAFDGRMTHGRLRTTTAEGNDIQPARSNMHPQRCNPETHMSDANVHLPPPFTSGAA